MLYVILDGDDIGLKIEKSFMENDESSLKQVNEDIKRIVSFISNYFVEEGLEIIFAGADGIICKGDDINIKELSIFVKKECLPYTFSIGIGDTLKSAFMALRYAKSINKNVTVSYSIKSDEFKIIRF